MRPLLLARHSCYAIFSSVPTPSRVCAHILSISIYCQNATGSLPDLLVCDTALHVGWSSEERSSQIGGGRMLTEFGAVSDAPRALEALGMSLRLADEHLASWAYWTFKSFDDITTSASRYSEGVYFPNGTLQHDKLRALTRPYAPVVAGTPLGWSYDDQRVLVENDFCP